MTRLGRYLDQCRRLGTTPNAAWVAYLEEVNRLNERSYPLDLYLFECRMSGVTPDPQRIAQIAPWLHHD